MSRVVSSFFNKLTKAFGFDTAITVAADYLEAIALGMRQRCLKVIEAKGMSIDYYALTQVFVNTNHS